MSYGKSDIYMKYKIILKGIDAPLSSEKVPCTVYGKWPFLNEDFLIIDCYIKNFLFSRSNYK